MDINLLVNITARAWSLPILAYMADGVAGRQAPLIAATGAGRTAFAQSMTHLIELGLVERNPGYGHPLRPEFRLTETGQAASVLAHRVHFASSGEEQKLLRRAWTVPVLGALKEPQTFSAIVLTLPTITDRALSQSLKSLEKQAWVDRQVQTLSRPPRALYAAINTGALVSEVVDAAVSHQP